MTEKRWLYFALGVTTVISIGAVTNQLVPLAPATGVAIGGDGITFPDGSVQTTAAPRYPRRAFYLGTTQHNGDQADENGVCDAGFHFASLFEILDVTSLRYDTGRGFNQADSGLGPPTLAPGWVRTGWISDGNQPNIGSWGDGGIRNCDAWTSNASDKDGTYVRLNACWQELADCLTLESAIAKWWQVFDGGCSVNRRVWCVEDYPGAAT